ncbi:type IV pilus twitching motility protein PilT [Glaciibacter flavus]|uniref:type IV pilus twitching motility protein PilT n=1 Tax=Orlajensenia flava TaxID=2565934 RepID=UPI003AFFFBE9
MTNAPGDLPVNPSGISFEDWAALLTNGSLPGSDSNSALRPGPAAAPTGDAGAIRARPTDAPSPAVPHTAAQAPTASDDDVTAALEASWRASLASDSPFTTTAPVADPTPSVAGREPTPTASPFDALIASPTAPEAAMDTPQHPTESAPYAPVVPEWPVVPIESLFAEATDEALAPVTDIASPPSFEASPVASSAASTFAQPYPTAPAAAGPSFDDLLAPGAASTGATTSFQLPPTTPIAAFAAAPTELIETAAPTMPGEDGARRRSSFAPEEPSAPLAPASVAPASPAPTAPQAAGSSVHSSPAADQPRVTRSARADGADAELIAALTEVVMQGGSDLHVTTNAAPNLRIHGGLKPLPGEKWSSDKVRAAIYTLLSAAQKQKFERELELDFAYTLSQNARFRVNVYQQRANIGAAFRLIPTEIKQLAELGVPESVGRFSTLPRGLVLVTGPTGSGKSTTLAALVDLVNQTRADHIVTVEDPIEFMHQHKKSLVNQREVGADTHSFAAALKHVLRQDPDVILVGELRDLETISVALTAAETGHLVFATLHTQSAAQSIDRIIDVYPPHQQNQVRAQLAATLQGVVTQTLIKKASGQGRVVATEVLITTPAVANLIREGQTHQVPTAMQAGASYGMHTLDQHLADLVNRGVITQQAAVDKAHDPEGMLSLVHRVETRDSAMSQTGVDFGDAYSARGRH